MVLSSYIMVEDNGEKSADTVHQNDLSRAWKIYSFHYYFWCLRNTFKNLNFRKRDFFFFYDFPHYMYHVSGCYGFDWACQNMFGSNNNPTLFGNAYIVKIYTKYKGTIESKRSNLTGSDVLKHGRIFSFYFEICLKHILKFQKIETKNSHVHLHVLRAYKVVS
jgi:hypothetical protein